MVWENCDFTILGTGIKKFMETQAIYEAAIINTGGVIDILELTLTWIDNDTGFPLYKIEFMKVNIPGGTRIIDSLPFDIMDLTESWIGIDNIAQSWTVTVQRF